jgi:hypothetical protein
MAHHQPEARLVSHLLEHRHRLAAAGDEPDAERPERCLDVGEALPLKRRVARVPLRLREHLGLVEKHREHGPAPRASTGFGERGMIRHAEVSLQPHTYRRL